MTSILEGYGNNYATLLSAGRQSYKGIGISARSRQLVDGFINSSSTGFNTLFGYATGPSLSTEGLQTQIKGLRASLPESRLSESVRGNTVDTTA